MMTNITKFDFSRFDCYRKCPLQFKWKYVEYRTPRKPPNMYYALPGIIVQKLFEHFYNDAWYLKRGGCREFMYNKAPEIYEKTLKWCNVDWNAHISKKTKSDVFDEFLDMIGPNLDLIKERGLLSKFAKSECTLLSNFGENKYVHLKSKVDFLIHTKDKGMQILDGKATSNKKNYLKDPSQLYFYAMMYNYKYKRYPDVLGYWWWRDADITYVDFDKSNIEKLQEEMDGVLYKIYKKKFDATPEYAACLFCSYSEECMERKKHVAEKQAEKATPITQGDLDSFL